MGVKIFGESERLPNIASLSDVILTGLARSSKILPDLILEHKIRFLE